MPFPRSHINLPVSSVFKALLALGHIPPEKWIHDFEERLSHYLEHKLILPVGSGRDALKLFLADLAPNGGEIIFPAYTYHPMPVLAASFGFKPVFVDVDPETWNLDPEKAREAITPRTKAIIPTHFLGVPAALTELRALADQYGIFLIEDCAHAFGSTYQKKSVGRMGDAGIFTFAMSKNMPCFGGGLLTVSDPIRFDRLKCRLIKEEAVSPIEIWRRQFGNVAAMIIAGRNLFSWTLYPLLRLADDLGSDIFDRKFIEDVYPPSVISPVSIHRMASLQAWIGCQQLNRFPSELKSHQANAYRLRQALEGVPGLKLQKIPSDRTSSCLSVRALIRDPIGFRSRLRQLGVDTRPDEMRNCAALSVLPPGPECPVTSSLAGRCIEIPCSSIYSPQEMDHIAEMVTKALD